MDQAVRATKEKMRREKEKAALELARKIAVDNDLISEAIPDEVVVKEKPQEEEEREGAETVVDDSNGSNTSSITTTTDEPSKDKEEKVEVSIKQENSFGDLYPPEYMPSPVTRRLPIKELRPRLHRKKEDVKIEKILFMMSTIDRGQRIGTWKGDKLETILVILDTFRALCERGFDVTVWFVAAWKASEEDKKIKEALYCERIKG